MAKRKKAVSLLLMICVLAVALLGNVLSGHMMASAAVQRVKSISVRNDGKNVTNKTVVITNGGTAKLVVKTNPVKAAGSVKFSSSNKSVAAVSSTGNVKAKRTGSARIKVTVPGKYIKKSVWVKIKVKEPGSQDEPQVQPDDVSGSENTEGSSEQNIPSQVSENPSGAPEEVSGKRILVAYFSRTGENYVVGVIEKGNTAVIADMIAEQTGGTEFEVATVQAYPDVYAECTEIARQEQTENARPQLKGTLPAAGDYDTIFIGFPIWWGDMPMAVYTFLESYDWSGKTVIPFCTHAGSGLSGTEDRIRQACRGAEVKNGLAIAGTMAQNSRTEAQGLVTEWLEGLGYKNSR